eukprot:TRINITY_DN3469_c0_g1_i2.p1 TRINITY_DN3469_c0_g1~~TRINITY_DN3469_c0_g1_i2.p1  ORF type:complete len:105 (+),score=33.84 TRINITY_DN3469_c0_g1_i2:81-395(+)
MARRSSSMLLVAALYAAALLALTSLAFVPAPASAANSLRGTDAAAEVRLDQGAQAVLLSAVLLPDAAHAANQGYALLQLGWAVFIIGLGPAVLFWIYFNKPEIL